MSDAASDRAQKYFIEQRKLDTTILVRLFYYEMKYNVLDFFIGKSFSSMAQYCPISIVK